MSVRLPCSAFVRREVAERVVRPGLAAVSPPPLDARPRVVEVVESAKLQALVSERALEAPHAGVLDVLTVTVIEGVEGPEAYLLRV